MMLIKKLNNKLFDKISSLSDNKFFFNIILILLLTLSFIIHLPDTPNNIILYKSTKFFMLSILLYYIFIRLYTKDFILHYDEKIIILFFSIAIFSSLINKNNLYLSIIEPSVYCISYLGISSFWVIKRDKEYIKTILILFLILSSVHFAFAYIPNFYRILFKIDYKASIKLIKSAPLWTGLHVNTNRIGFSMLVSFFSSSLLLIYYIKEGKAVKKIIHLVILSLIFLTAVLISQSRNCTLAVTCFIIVELFIFRKVIIESIKQKNKFLISSIIICLILFSILIYLKIFDNIINKTLLHGSTKRFEFWNLYIINQIENFNLKTFFLGQGYTGKINLFYINLPKSYTSMHNLFLENWGRYGILAAFLFMSYIFHIIKKASSNINMKYLIAIPISMFLYSLFEDLLFFTYLWMEDLFFLFIVYAQIRLKDS